MYLDESAPGDYQADAPPAGFVETDSGIIDFQDRDLSESTLEEVGVVLENALSDLERLAYYHRNLTQTLKNGVTTESALHLRLAANHRLKMARSYGMSAGSKLAAETIRYASDSSLIFAIEEEAAEEKGFFAKMIDAICRAFSWLWEKLTGLFRKKKKDKDEEKVKKGLEDLKAAEEQKLKPLSTHIEESSLVAAFGFLGSTVNAGMITNMVRAQHDHLSKMEKLLELCATSFERLVNVSKNENASPETIRGMVSINEQYILMVVMGFQKRKPDDLEKHGGVYNKAIAVEDTMLGLDQFIAGNQLFVWKEKHGNLRAWTAHFGTPKEKPKSTLEFGSHHDLLPLTDTVYELSKYNKDIGEKIAKHIEAAGEKRNIEQLEKNLKAAIERSSDDSQKADLGETIKQVRQVGSYIARLSMAAARAADSVTHTVDQGENYILASTSREFEKPTEAKPA